VTALSLPFEPATTDPPRRFWRLVRETAVGAYDVLKRTGRRDAGERAVYVGVAAYYNRHQRWPTAMELFEFLTVLRTNKPEHARYRRIKDINNVRPRLTEMSTHGRRAILRGPKRPCTSARSGGATVLTWMIPQR
jgi:hypothetical protein